MRRGGERDDVQKNAASLSFGFFKAYISEICFLGALKVFRLFRYGGDKLKRASSSDCRYKSEDGLALFMQSHCLNKWS